MKRSRVGIVLIGAGIAVLVLRRKPRTTQGIPRSWWDEVVQAISQDPGVVEAMHVYGDMSLAPATAFQIEENERSARKFRARFG